MKILHRLDDILQSIRIGIPVKTANGGNPIDMITIKYKDVYLFVDIDCETGNPTGDFGWSHDPTMNPTVPIRDVWTATPPKKEEL